MMALLLLAQTFVVQDALLERAWNIDIHQVAIAREFHDRSAVQLHVRRRDPPTQPPLAIHARGSRLRDVEQRVETALWWAAGAWDTGPAPQPHQPKPRLREHWYRTCAMERNGELGIPLAIGLAHLVRIGGAPFVGTARGPQGLPRGWVMVHISEHPTVTVAVFTCEWPSLLQAGLQGQRWWMAPMLRWWRRSEDFRR